MYDLLFNYGIRLFDALIMLLLIGIGVIFGYLFLRKQHLKQVSLLNEQKEELLSELNKALEQRDQTYFKTLYSKIYSLIGHELERGLFFILRKSEETLQELKTDQVTLRDKQERIVQKSTDLIQHAKNVVGFFTLKEDEAKLVLVKPRQIVEQVLLDLYPYAEARGVAIRPHLADVDPISINRHFVQQILTNVVHNAISFSPRGTIVDVTLDLQVNDTVQHKAVCVEVKDRGVGIEEKDKERIFELQARGDGSIQPGSGLGLHYARKLAQFHGGDLLLVESAIGQGSVFKVVLPYR